MLERILGIILPVFLIIGLGFFYARRVKPDMSWVNRINMNVLASGLLALPFAYLLGEDRRTFVPPIMFNNCGNMGLPLAVLAFGQQGFSAMVALFTISNLMHFTLGVW